MRRLTAHPQVVAVVAKCGGAELSAVWCRLIGHLRNIGVLPGGKNDGSTGIAGGSRLIDLVHQLGTELLEGQSLRSRARSRREVLGGLENWIATRDDRLSVVRRYMKTVAKTAFIDRRRKQQRPGDVRKVIFFGDALESMAHSAPGAATEVATAEWRDAMLSALRAQLAVFGNRWRMVFCLHFEGVSHLEIAVQLGITPENSRTILSRMLARLKANETLKAMYEQLKNAA